MRPYACPRCPQMVFFDDLSCEACGIELAFSPSSETMIALEEAHACDHRAEIGCSWAVEDEASPSCRSCRTTVARPPAEDAGATAAWAEAEAAKRQLFAQAISLGFDVEGARFALKSGAYEPVTTGHADGLVTIDVRESDDVVRTRMRARMGEAYRTMLGHFRHEIGHYVWMVEVDGTDRLESCRARFGDDRQSYADALEAHYAGSPPADWADHFVSEYASAHPWEDFAETFAHYLHIRDTLETAETFGVTVSGDHPVLEADPNLDDAANMRAIIERWLPLTYALNALNRSMGARPLYPFVLSEEVIAKLGWIHRLLTGRAVPKGDANAAA